MPPVVALRLTMLLHDIGKPFTWKEQDGRDCFEGHSEAGYTLAGRILERLRYEKKTIAQVQQLIGQHERMLQPEEICLRKAVADLGYEGVRNLIAVKRADVWAHSDAMAKLPLEPFDHMEHILKQMEERGDCCSLKQLAVSGKELTALGYKGRQVGDILDQLLQLVLEDPARNQKEYLLEQLNEMKEERL